jgi:hypothetical protein
MGSFKKYNTVRDFEEAIIEIPVIYPGIGDTGEIIKIRSRYSREFREASAKAERQISTMMVANKGEMPSEDVLQEIENAQFTALIAEWSFDEDLTAENVAEFMKANPQIRDEINRKAAQDSLFLNK